MDRETEKRLRYLAQDIQTEEDALKATEDRALRVITKLGSLRALKFKIECHERLKEAEDDGS